MGTAAETDVDVAWAEGRIVSDSAKQLRPFVRWAGSKRLLLRQIRALVPASFGTYFEPFLGGGSLLLAIRPDRAVVGDALEPLMSAWRSIKHRPQSVLNQLSTWSFDEQTYAQLRGARFQTEVEKAAQFLYLNRGAYGGLWRVNKKGTFNVPWATPKTPSEIDEQNLFRVSSYLNQSSVLLITGDYAKTTINASAGDFVFLDPPYSRGRPVRPFIEYTHDIFSWDSQIALAREAARLRDLGASVIVTNSSHPDVLSLYPGFRTLDVTRHSSLGSHVGSSRTITERIFASV
ncbi:DNA adenine methylase Dam [Curtobacterium sp. PhB136]|nr:DNA adenine methylase Dam [Curtobacterium sp. PhB136]